MLLLNKVDVYFSIYSDIPIYYIKFHLYDRLSYHIETVFQNVEAILEEVLEKLKPEPEPEPSSAVSIYSIM